MADIEALRARFGELAGQMAGVVRAVGGRDNAGEKEIELRGGGVVCVNMVTWGVIDGLDKATGIRGMFVSLNAPKEEDMCVLRTAELTLVAPATCVPPKVGLQTLLAGTPASHESQMTTYLATPTRMVELSVQEDKFHPQLADYWESHNESESESVKSGATKFSLVNLDDPNDEEGTRAELAAGKIEGLLADVERLLAGRGQ